MKRLYLALLCFVINVSISASNNEFVQTKKKHGKRVSVDTLQRSNIEKCSDALESSANLVEGLGKLQKDLQQCTKTVFEQDTRTFHEQENLRLKQATNLLQQMEDLLDACQECLQNNE